MSPAKYNYTSDYNDTEHDETNIEKGDQTGDIISHEQMTFIMQVLMFGVTPAISILGIVGNIFSIIILLKHGLHKCSNILLISLAVSDLTYLVAFNSVPKILYEVVGIQNGYGYSQDVSLALFIFFHIFNILDYAVGSVSLTLPMLITFERLVAVYLPFKFNLIITPTRTWCAVAAVTIFWFTFFLYMSFWMSFSYTYDPLYNISVGRMERSSLYYDSQSTVKIFEQVADYMVMKIPAVATLIGCIFISVKVKMASSQRQKMTRTNSKGSSYNRTTKMLLAVCVVYILVCVILSMPMYFPDYVQYSMFSDPPNNLSPILYHVVSTVVCINSSINFIVYVVMNKNFRDTYKSLFTTRKGPKL